MVSYLDLRIIRQIDCFQAHNRQITPEILSEILGVSVKRIVYRIRNLRKKGFLTIIKVGADRLIYDTSNIKIRKNKIIELKEMLPSSTENESSISDDIIQKAIVINSELTDIEKDILNAIHENQCNGFFISQYEISTLLGIHVSTTRYHLRKLRLKKLISSRRIDNRIWIYDFGGLLSIGGNYDH